MKVRKSQDKVTGLSTAKYPESTLEVETKQVMMHNVSSLPLTVVLKATYPFQLLVEDPRWALSMSNLLSRKCHSVLFDPSYKDDFVTRTAESQLEVSFKQHPQKDFVNLKGEVFFPNLTFEMEKVDFGCILNDTEVTQVVIVTNHSPMDVKYQWSFIDSAIQFENKEEDEGIGGEVDDDSQPEDDEEEDEAEETAVNVMIELPDHPSPESPPVDNRTGSSLGSRPSTAEEQRQQETSPVNQPLMSWGQSELMGIGIDEIFDILPLYSTLHSHESQKIQFTFYGHANISSQAVARCSVHGGPDYDIELLGQASLVQYFFDRQIVDYGKQLFDQAAVAEIVLHNTGKVGLNFVVLNVDSGNKLLPGALMFHQSKGTSRL
ncbi:hypothetical protein OS493_015662 [Desmophyllum pertusum]|uniref:Uncharacterized protein n=1 Tax=Desmophyllum pertusum TaxID=174260 RepID=A0A9W9YPB2_9CNID|nr:hypothetical protein OS493_015662 [Desmophyllum pertusum]